MSPRKRVGKNGKRQRAPEKTENKGALRPKKTKKKGGIHVKEDVIDKFFKYLAKETCEARKKTVELEKREQALTTELVNLRKKVLGPKDTADFILKIVGEVDQELCEEMRQVLLSPPPPSPGTSST